MTFIPQRYDDIPQWIRDLHERLHPGATDFHADWAAESLWSLVRDVTMWDGQHLAAAFWTDDDTRWVACTLIGRVYAVWTYTRNVDLDRGVETFVDDDNMQTFVPQDEAVSAIQALLDREEEAASFAQDGAPRE